LEGGEWGALNYREGHKKCQGVVALGKKDDCEHEIKP